jgi:hypothetical protein
MIAHRNAALHGPHDATAIALTALVAKFAVIVSPVCADAELSLDADIVFVASICALARSVIPVQVVVVDAPAMAIATAPPFAGLSIVVEGSAADPLTSVAVSNAVVELRPVIENSTTPARPH